jgi:hypothetical protein
MDEEEADIIPAYAIARLASNDETLYERRAFSGGERT